MRLDVALAERVGSRAKAARLIDAGLVTVDGVQRAKSFDVDEGMQIDVAPEPERVPDTRGEGVEFGIAYEVFGLPRPEMEPGWYRFAIAGVEPEPLRFHGPTVATRRDGALSGASSWRGRSRARG